MNNQFIIVTLYFALLYGCATQMSPLSTNSLLKANRSLEAAEAAGAADYAPLELRFGTEKLERAKKLYNDQKFKAANILAEEAYMDNRLAEIKSFAATARKRELELKEHNTLLTNELANLKQSLADE